MGQHLEQKYMEEHFPFRLEEAAQSTAKACLHLKIFYVFGNLIKPLFYYLMLYNRMRNQSQLI